MPNPQENRALNGLSRIKMINFIILIGLSLSPIACKEEAPSAPQGVAPLLGEPAADQTGPSTGQGIAVSGGVADQEDASADPEELSDEELLRRMREETPDPSTVQGGPEVMSQFPPEADSDGDGFIDMPVEALPNLPVDNCPQFANPDQADRNGNGIGDACE